MSGVQEVITISDDEMAQPQKQIVEKRKNESDGENLRTPRRKANIRRRGATQEVIVLTDSDDEEAPWAPKKKPRKVLNEIRTSTPQKSPPETTRPPTPLAPQDCATRAPTPWAPPFPWSGHQENYCPPPHFVMPPSIHHCPCCVYNQPTPINNPMQPFNTPQRFNNFL